MAKPIAPADGIAFAFPDVCLTPAPPAPPVPVPYPNVAQLKDATGITDVANAELLVGGKHVLLLGSMVATSTGDEAGSAGGGVTTGTIKGPCEMIQASATVVYGPSKKGLVRFLDQTAQNKQSAVQGSPGNAQGMVLSAFPTILVGD